MVTKYGGYQDINTNKDYQDIYTKCDGYWDIKTNLEVYQTLIY